MTDPEKKKEENMDNEKDYEGWGPPCCFCGRGLNENYMMSAGPTSNYPNCCPSCFNKHVIDHMNPKCDILAQQSRTVPHRQKER